jgi:hypothetical protein
MWLEPAVARILAQRGGERSRIGSHFELGQPFVYTLSLAIDGILQALEELLKVSHAGAQIVDQLAVTQVLGPASISRLPLGWR